MKYYKMHGLGNDFIIIDLISNSYSEAWVDFAKKYCDRHTGIGADGVLLVEKSETADASMRLINADGSEAEMCGNGIRCVAKFMMEFHNKSSPVTIDTLAGIMKIEKLNGKFKVDMGEPNIGTTSTISVGSTTYAATLVDMGNPHAVIFVDDFDFNWMKDGREIEHNDQFPNRTNVEFVKVMSPNELDVKVWERGAGATLACGTGACATLAAAVAKDKAQKKATIHLRGGDLEIEIGENNHIFMTGPAEFVYEGEIV